METSFEVTTNLEKIHYVELYKYAYRKRIKWVLINSCVCVLCTLLGIARSSILLIGVGIWNGIIAVNNYMAPWKTAKKAIEQDRRFENSDTICSVSKFEDAFHDESVRQTSSVPYDKIDEILIAEHTIAIIDVRTMAYVMDKNGFTKGTFEEFLPFIQKKCPQAKIIMR